VATLLILLAVLMLDPQSILAVEFALKPDTSHV